MIEIRNLKGEVIYTSDAETLREAVEKAVKADAYLTCAYLTNANLTNAYMYRANLSDADLTGAFGKVRVDIQDFARLKEER